MKVLLSISTIILAVILQASAADKGIADYFLELPPQDFETHPALLLERIRRGDARNSFIDSRNGFMYVQGDGELIQLEIALFRYANGRPLLAIASAEYADNNFSYLSFFTEKGSKMVPVNRAILPVGDSSDLRFELPRMGLTLIVRDSSGNVVSRWTWNRTSFIQD
jgi:hypothetical protein